MPKYIVSATLIKYEVIEKIIEANEEDEASDLFYEQLENADEVDEIEITDIEEIKGE